MEHHTKEGDMGPDLELTYTYGEYKTAHHVNCVTELEAWSTYYRHAAQHSRRTYIDGAMYFEMADILERQQQGWRTWLFPVEIGASGFPADSQWKMLGAMGLNGHVRMTAVCRLERSAERASSWLWSRRDERSWKPVTNT
ncbi:hypothetical protein DPMN_035602 [Dreissena polymorpha]|uniref:Uncharacterized protein n=1 Tax=Dreissena polymorpha TaxID=45954 RepID=A0A9D4RKQ8_DREPO|nr:hypothetical protein DPMN_035602 [Dreissena polymorpha]